MDVQRSNSPDRQSQSVDTEEFAKTSNSRPIQLQSPSNCRESLAVKKPMIPAKRRLVTVVHLCCQCGSLIMLRAISHPEKNRLIRRCAGPTITPHSRHYRHVKEPIRRAKRNSNMPCRTLSASAGPMGRCYSGAGTNEIGPQTSDLRPQTSDLGPRT